MWGVCQAQRLQTESLHATVAARCQGNSPTHACYCSPTHCVWLRLPVTVRTNLLRRKVSWGTPAPPRGGGSGLHRGA
jgi:hypothetical protein